MTVRKAKKRQFPSSEGWRYLTIENISGKNKENIISNLTCGYPEMYEIAYWARSKGTAFIIIRRKPVLMTRNETNPS